MMTRRSFLRRATIVAGAVATASYNGLDFLAEKIPAVDTAAKALGLRSTHGIPEWNVYFWWLGGRRVYEAEHVMNIPLGNLPPMLANWNGVQYERYKYDVNTLRAWYLRS